MQKATFLLTQLKITIFPFLILFKRIESIDMTLCVISFLVIVNWSLQVTLFFLISVVEHRLWVIVRTV